MRTRADGHHLRTQSEERAFHDGVAQIGTRQGAAELPPLSGNCFLQIDHHHHTCLHRCAEQGDEADPHRHGEVVAEQPEQVDPARQRERDSEKDVRGLDGGVIGEIQQQENDEQHDGQHNLELLPCMLLVLPAPAPLHEIA